MLHEAPPASDGTLGRPNKMGVHGMISLVLFVAFLVFFAGILTGLIDGKEALAVVRDAISYVGGRIADLIAR